MANFRKILIFQAKIGYLQLFLGKLFYFSSKSLLSNILPVHDKIIIIFYDPSTTPRPPLRPPTTPLPKIWGVTTPNPPGLTPMDMYVCMPTTKNWGVEMCDIL